MDVLCLIVPKMVCNPLNKIAGHSMPNHLFTAPPETSQAAKAIMHDIGIRNDTSKAKDPDVDMFSKLPLLYSMPLVLSLMERLLQEIGLETIARAMEKDRQHVDSLPFAILAMGSCLVSV